MPARRDRPPRFLIVVLAAALAGALMVIPTLARSAVPSAGQQTAQVDTRPAELLAAAASAAAPVRWTSVSAVRGAGMLRIVGARSDRSVGLLASLPAGGFTAVRTLGKPVSGGAAVLYAAGRYEVVAIGADHRLRVRTGAGTTWSGWRVLGNSRFSGTPAAVRVSATDLRIVAAGTDHRLYYVTVTGTTAGKPLAIAGAVAGAPAVTYQASTRRLEVFWTSSNGALHKRTLASRRWGKDGILGRGYLAGVGAVVTASGSYRVVTVRRDHHVMIRTGNAAGWRPAADLGGSVTGAPAITWDAARRQFDVIAAGTDGVLQKRSQRDGRWTGWSVVNRPAGLSTAKPVDVLLARWGGSLTGLPGVLADLRTTKSGGTIVNACGTRVRLDPRLLTLLVAVTDRYHVMVNNMVTGHSCDAAQHPKGRAIDFNIVVDPRTGASTNLHSGGSGDNDTLDRQFVSFLAGKLPAAGGVGQRYCGSRGSAAVPATVRFFSDTCNHQHAQVATG